jgi:hypothetical protein
MRTKISDNKLKQSRNQQQTSQESITSRSLYLNPVFQKMSVHLQTASVAEALRAVAAEHVLHVFREGTQQTM